MSSASKHNHNYVRLNLKNKSGSCQGRRHHNSRTSKPKQQSRNQFNSVRVDAVVDPIHDYLDGVSLTIKCPRHVDVPTVLHQVKSSNKNGNAGKWGSVV